MCVCLFSSFRLPFLLAKVPLLCRQFCHEKRIFGDILRDEMSFLFIYLFVFDFMFAFPPPPLGTPPYVCEEKFEQFRSKLRLTKLGDVHSSGWNVQFWSCGGSGLLVVLKSWQTALVFGEANRMTRAQPGERFCWQGNLRAERNKNTHNLPSRRLQGVRIRQRESFTYLNCSQNFHRLCL